MKSLITIIISICIIVYLVTINNYLSSHYIPSLDYTEVNKFNTDYNKVNEHQSRARYQNIVIIVIDGVLRKYMYDENISKNIVERWKNQGLRFDNAHTMMPTVSAVNYYSIMTGAPSFIHGVTSNSNRFKRNIKIKPIFTFLKKDGLDSAVIGFEWYKDLIHNETVYYPVECCEKDDSREVTETLLNLITSGKLPAVTLAHYLAPDNAAHKSHSNSSTRYIRAIKEIDDYVGTIFRELDKSYPESLVFLLSDHGMNVDGNHGGSDKNSLRIPLYIFAGDIPKSNVSRKIYNISIAPTIHALLGKSLPAFSCGNLIHELIDADNKIKYLTESVEKKQKIVGALNNIEVYTSSQSEDQITGLINREIELTDEILEYPQKQRDELLSKQRILAALILLIFIILVIYRTGPGLPALLVLNSIIITSMGIAMKFINCRYRWDIAIAIYLICFTISLIAYWNMLLNINMKESLETTGGFFNVLAFLFVATIIISLFFIPFYTHVPDQEIFRFRFYQVAFIHPVLFLTLLKLLIHVDKKE